MFHGQRPSLSDVEKAAGTDGNRTAPAAVSTTPWADYDQIFDGVPPWGGLGEATHEILDVLSKAMRDDTAGPPDDNGRIPAGYTYLGQLIVHDLTHFRQDPFEPTSERGRRRNRNLRSPTLDLDCIYGRGPEASALLYEPPNGDRRAFRYLLRLGKTGAPFTGRPAGMPAGCPFDLPRLTEGGDGLFGGSNQVTADPIIADPRNDDHLLIAQLHLVFARLHNRVANAIRLQQSSNRQTFLKAREFVVRCYQDVIRHDYLKRLLATSIYQDFQRDEPLFVQLPVNSPIRKNKALLPLEFPAAAARVGHSMVRNHYTLNGTLPDRKTPTDLSELLELSGFEMNRPLAVDWVVEWSRFFGDRAVPSRRITPFLSHHFQYWRPRFEVEPRGRLGFLDLWRSYQAGLPSGQSLAEKLDRHLLGSQKEVRARVLRGSDMMPTGFSHGQSYGGELLNEILSRQPKLQEQTPLYYYLLQEAAVEQGGLCLGLLGSFITALTFKIVLPHDGLSKSQVVSDMPHLLRLLEDDTELESALEMFSSSAATGERRS